LRNERLRIEHWDNAVRQAEVAASTVTGGSKAYDWQPYFYTDQFDLGMEYVGHGSATDEVVIRGDQSSGEFIVFWTRDGRVTAARRCPPSACAMNRFPSANSDPHGRTRGVGGCGRRPRIVCVAYPSGRARARAAVPVRCPSGILKGMDSLFADEAFDRRPRIV